MTALGATNTMKSQPREITTADRGALGLIGLLLGTATVLVTITAAVVVSGYRGIEVQNAANLRVAAVAATSTR